MKNIYLLIIACISFYNVAKAQTMINIDFKSKSAPSMKNINNIKRGEFFQININNINQNLYKISLTTIDTVISKPQQTTSFGKFELDALSKVIAGISPFSTMVAQSQTLTSPTDLSASFFSDLTKADKDSKSTIELLRRPKSINFTSNIALFTTIGHHIENRSIGLNNRS